MLSKYKKIQEVEIIINNMKNNLQDASRGYFKRKKKNHTNMTAINPCFKFSQES